MTMVSNSPATPVASRLVSSEYRRFAAEVSRRTGADEVVLLTTMPRGGLQICRRLHLHDGLIRRYHAELHRQDRLAWHVIQTGAAGSEQIGSGLIDDTPLAHGFSTILAIRIDSPVFNGYPGVLLAMRHRHGNAQAIDVPTETAELSRLFNQHLRPSGSHPSSMSRQFIFDASGRCIYPNEGLASVDPKLAGRLTELAAGAARSETEPSPDDIRDADGLPASIKAVRVDDYPALDSGPVIFVSLLPDVADWSALTADRFEADSELARLAQSIDFIVKNFHEGPTLKAIAASVPLSQFHFHRRFYELFGLTPKRLLYDLQLDLAKHLLSNPVTPLSEIARTCGFAHQSHFTSRFRQGAGLTPTRWRKKMGVGSE